MRLVPAGVVTIGDVNASPAERPVHQVTLDPFYLDATEVTNIDFGTFVAATGFRTTAECLDSTGVADQALAIAQGRTWRTFATGGRELHPVVCVSWHDAVAYAHWAGKRLPTEAEWEAAARGGLAGKLYPWGDAPPDRERCNWDRADAFGDGRLPTAVSRELTPNGFGLQSMAGNVWEWCADWFGESYYGSSAAVNPAGPVSGEYRVRRGGAWNVREAFRLRCANRGAMQSDAHWPNLGFRCALTIKRDR
jgi:formylglycine-generating enzyme required for sulfatase activity